MSELTRTQVLAALERPVEKEGNGYRCRMCPRVLPKRSSVGVHELTHRRAVGLAPAVATGRRGRAGPKVLACGYDGCTKMVQRHSLQYHLINTHKLSLTDASFWIRRRVEEVVSQNEAPAVPVLPSADDVMGILGEPPSVMSDLTAVEAVTGILSAARTDGLIPTRMLPQVHQLVSHTDSVLDELRRLSDGD
jgi:hypothetical protein